MTTPQTATDAPDDGARSASRETARSTGRRSESDGSVRRGYLMEGENETDRLQLKTEQVLVQRHLDWACLAPGQSFVDLGCGSGEVLLAAAPGRSQG